MYKRINIIVALIFVLFFTACSSSSKEPKTIKSKNRTVLVYIAGANSLRSLVNADLQEMKEGLAKVDSKDLDLANLLVYREASGSKERLKPQLLKLERKGEEVYWEVVKEYNSQISTDVEVMSQVFTDVYSDYTADSYGLVLWSHADGWLYAGHSRINSRWFGQDYDGSDYHYMDIIGLNEALKSAPHLDFLLFDACFMQSLEVAYQLKDKADFMLGSPTEIPGPGAPYQFVIPALFQDAKSVAFDVAEAYYDYYSDKYNGGVGSSNSNWTSGVSMAVLNMKELDAFAYTTNSVLSENELKYDALNFTDVMYYDKQSRVRYYYIDMLGVMKNNISIGYSEWEKSFNRLIPYFKTTPTNYSSYVRNFSMIEANGLSFYVPRSPISGFDFEKENNYYKTLDWWKVMQSK